MGAAVEAEAGVLPLAHRAHVADPGGGNQQPHPGVPHPERSQLRELLGEVEAEVGAADHRVDALRAAQVVRARAPRPHARRRRRETHRGPRPAAPARRRPGARRSDQMLRAGLERRQQVEAGDAAPRAAAPALLVEGDDDDGRWMALDQARGDDPDHARVPALPGEDEALRLAQPLGELPQRRLRRRRRPRARSPRLSPLARFSSVAISSARPSSAVRNSSTPASAR